VEKCPIKILKDLVAHDIAQDQREGLGHCIELQRAIDFLSIQQTTQTREAEE
jgi:hypothetical protein